MNGALDCLNLPVISTSLDSRSKSRALAELATAMLRQAGHDSPLIDLAETPLAPFDNSSVFETEAFRQLHGAIDAADAVMLAAPIYNWGIGSSAKNLIEATGATGDAGQRAAWFDKPVTFLCAGGLPHSYMAYTQLAASMMLDFKCIVNPYVVYASERDWDESGSLSETLTARLAKTTSVHVELATLLAGRSYSSEWEI